MATFSPSPVPQRPGRSSFIHSRRGCPNSGYSTPVARHVNDNASVASMDIDEAASAYSERVFHRNEVLFAKSDEMTVSFYATLPVEVKQTLKNADFYSDAYSGGIDTATGFSVVASQHTCFVWQHAQAVRSTPTCYIFSCPPAEKQQGPPFHSLVPYGSSREPGLILISPLGNIRFWHSIGIGLAGGDQFSASSLNLEEGDNVTTLCRSDTQTYFAATSLGQIFRLSLASSGAKHVLTSHTFSRPSPSLSLSRFLPSLFTSSSTANPSMLGPGYVSSIALGANTLTGGKEVWALINTRVQKWDVKAEGWEEPIFDEEATNVILPLLKTTLRNPTPEDANLDLELLDMAIDGQGKLVVLVSYAGGEEEIDAITNISLTAVKRMYALVTLSNLADALSADKLFVVPYQSTSSSGAPMHPRIQLVLGGRIVAVQFGDAVVLCSPSSGYYDRLELKSATDRSLGVGVIEGESTVLVLTAATMMKSYLDADKVESFDEETGRADLIKSTMTQAILYGASAENPLHFSFPPDVDADSLMEGAQQLSQAILESDPGVVRPNHDLGAQLTGRMDRLQWLIQFVNNNGVLPKISQRARQRLATDAEKLYACQQLWQQLSDSAGPLPPVLLEGVRKYMNEIRTSEHEDYMRDFLRYRIQDVGRFLRAVMDVTLTPTDNPNGGLAIALPDTNRAILAILNSAFEYREHHLATYGIELPMLRPWTSKPAIIDIVLGLFESSTAVISPSEYADAATQQHSELRAQLPDLAAVLFACLKERLDWLASPVAQSEPNAINDTRELEQRFALLRPEVLETLRSSGHAARAFGLAEQYRDFMSLVTLCHKDSVYPPQDNPHVNRIGTYLSRFKYEFARELYQWYIQHGELRVMFSDGNNSHSTYMDKYFAENPNTSVSWLHDVENSRYASAAGALMAESKSASSLSVKHFELSLGKLSHLAEMQENGGDPDQSMMDEFHNDLDLVSVHETLIEELQSCLKVGQARRHLDGQVDIVTKTLAAKLANKPAYLHAFKGFVRDLLQRKVLSTEDMIDLLTLKDNSNTVDSYSKALQLLIRGRDLPDVRRRSCFKTIWRRLCLHDDWKSIRKTASVTDSEIIRKYKQTALFDALSTVSQKPRNDVAGYDLTPNEMLGWPTTAEIASRWPGLPQEQIEALEKEYKAESDAVEALALGDVYYRIRELATEGR